MYLHFLFLFGVAVNPSCTAGLKYSIIARQLDSSFAPPLWHSSIMIRSKKSSGYSSYLFSVLSSISSSLSSTPQS